MPRTWPGSSTSRRSAWTRARRSARCWPPGRRRPPRPNLDMDKQTFAWIPEDDFVHHFAGDIDPVRARGMFAVQQALSASTLQDVMEGPAWKSHPTWFLVAANDEAIPPDAERQFAQRMGATTVEVESGHVAMGSHADEVTQLITTAAEAVA